MSSAVASEGAGGSAATDSGGAGALQTHTAPVGLLDALRILAYSALLVMALAVGGGWYLFAFSGIIVAASLVMRTLAGGVLFPLAAAAEAGFLVLFVVEGLGDSGQIASQHGEANYLTASAYVCAAFAVVMLGHQVVYRRARRSPQRWTDIFVPRVRRMEVAVAALYVAYVASMLPRVLLQIQGGRLAGYSSPMSDTVLGPAIDGLQSSAGFMLPAMVGWIVLRAHRASFLWAVLFSMPVLAIHFFIGTRFPLLFALAGLLVVRWAPTTLRPAVVLRVLLAAVVLLALSSGMRTFRAEGFSNLEPGEVIAAASEDLPRGESVMRVMTEMVAWFEREPNMGGSSSSAVLAFWVPRAVWEDKPELLGYWFPRRYGQTTAFGESHSVSYGFAGDAYADFGFAGGLAMMLPLGMLFGLADRWASRQLARSDPPTVVLTGAMYGMAFFAIRSLNTTLITATGMVVLSAVFVRLAGSRVRAGPVAPPADPSPPSRGDSGAPRRQDFTSGEGPSLFSAGRN